MQSGNLIFGDPRSIVVVDIVNLTEWLPLQTLIVNGIYHGVTVIITANSVPSPLIQSNVDCCFLVSQISRIEHWIAVDQNQLSQAMSYAIAHDVGLVWHNKRLYHCPLPLPKQSKTDVAQLPTQQDRTATLA
jgi:hypothetical protein